MKFFSSLLFSSLLFSSLLFSSLLLTTGCASILKGSDQPININSNVDSAEVYVNEQLVGRTPFTGTIERRSRVNLRVSKEGYQSRSLILDTSIEPVFWVNVFVGGVWGSTTDWATGSMWKVSPNTYNVDLKKSVGK